MAWSVRNAGGTSVASDGVVRLALGDARWCGTASAATSLSVERRIEPVEGRCRLGGRIRNTGTSLVALQRYRLAVDEVVLAPSPGRWRFYANGYQSWTQSRSFGPEEAVRVPRVGFARLMQDNLHNLASGKRGHFTAEMYAVLGDLDAPRFLLIGQSAPYAQFVYVRARFSDETPTLTLVWDFGGKELPAGGEVSLDPVWLDTDRDPNRLVDRYFDAAAGENPAREHAPGELPVGWCSWYYYFTKVGAGDVLENLDEAVRRQTTWQFFQLDDGYQTAVGDWLSLSSRYPDGLRPLVERIEAAGMRAGIWFAPFSARANSRLAGEHPDWFLKDGRGVPASVGWNPMWGLGGRLFGLDPTHPDAQDYLREVTRTFVHEWGFTYLKLDFLYSACVYARAYDPTLSPAERLQLGYRIIREAAGDAVFLLGCGAPLAPSIGYVDGMRIGPDVAPFWFPTLRYHLTRDPHALSARFAIRSTLTRAPMHRRLWENDPDCLLIRDTKTRLTADERETLTNAIAISGGMFLVSDRLTRLSGEAWERLRRVEDIARACTRGRCRPLDFMEREMPELVHNTAGYLAVFHFGPRPLERRRLTRDGPLGALIPADATLRSLWDDRSFRWAPGGTLELGPMAPHSSLLLEIGR